MRKPKILPFVFRALFALGVALIVSVLGFTDQSFGDRVLFGCGVLLILVGSGGLQELSWQRLMHGDKRRERFPDEQEAGRVDAEQNAAEAAE